MVIIKKDLALHGGDAFITGAAIIEKTGTILYIEDNVPNAELVEDILGSYRPAIRLITTPFGERAVQFATDFVPDFILLDLDLPDIHGIEVFANLLANDKTKSIPVIILSADALTDKIENLMKAGAVDYLTKPLDVATFLKVVDSWMGAGSRE